jgi:CRISPR/Cas system type I-B associated protein Csh2 (Cas7 group RAMP superfamily)
MLLQPSEYNNMTEEQITDNCKNIARCTRRDLYDMPRAILVQFYNTIPAIVGDFHGWVCRVEENEENGDVMMTLQHDDCASVLTVRNSMTMTAFQKLLVSSIQEGVEVDLAS